MSPTPALLFPRRLAHAFALAARLAVFVSLSSPSLAQTPPDGTGAPPPAADVGTPAAVEMPATANDPASGAVSGPAVDANEPGGTLNLEEAPAPPPVPPARKSLMSTTRTPDYSVPLSFDPSESGVLMPPVEIPYDLTGDGGRTLRIGHLTLNGKNFFGLLRTPASLLPELRGVPGVKAMAPALILKWPEEMVAGGQLEFISRSGRVLWQKNVGESELASFQAQKDIWRKELLARGFPSERLRSGLLSASYIIQDIDNSGARFWGTNEIFRMCITRNVGTGMSRLCSSRYSTFRSGKTLGMKRLPWHVSPRVVALNKTVAPKGLVTAPEEGMTQFYAELAGGETYEFLANAPKLNIVDFSDTAKPGVLRVSGFGLRPLAPYVILNPDTYSRLTIALGFEPTIGDTRKFWACAVTTDSPYLDFPAEAGGVFRQRFELNAIPRSSARIHLSRKSPKGTYASEIALYGRKLPDSNVDSQENSVRLDRRDPTKFTWFFRADKPAELNRSYLTVDYEGHTYKSFYELARSYANELSGRLSAIVGASTPILMGDVSYNHWFEDFWGWDQYYLTQQRWGVSARYFKSLNQIPAGGVKANLDVITLDVKYRFNPGLWTLDESTGAIFAYQQVKFGTVTAPMTGFGAFWARSMPRALDEWFNLLPLLNYPKWVDVEFIYFVNSLNKDVRLNSTMALNFHGQVLWKKNYFGEAGFGFKRYGFTDQAAAEEAKLNTVYTTVGAGVKF